MPDIAKCTVKVDDQYFAPGEELPPIKDKKERARLLEIGVIAPKPVAGKAEKTEGEE